MSACSSHEILHRLEVYANSWGYPICLHEYCRFASLLEQLRSCCTLHGPEQEAIKKYTECLDRLPIKSSELAVKCYSNRAACYKQLSNFDATIEDTTAVLDVKPNDVKALVRRAQAFEAIERQAI